MSTAPTGSPGPTTWTDDQAPDPTWAAPVAGAGPAAAESDAPVDADPVRRPRPALIWGAIGLALVLIVAAVWGLGGFRYRQDLFTPVEPGAVFTVGPYELAFTEATVQYLTEKRVYEVRAVGTGRTTGEVSIAPSSLAGSSFSYAQDPVSREIHPVETYRYGTGDEIFLRPKAFVPGLAPIPFTAQFEFTGPVSERIRLVLFDQEFSDRSVFGDQDPTWNNRNTGYDLALTVKRLPDSKY